MMYSIKSLIEREKDFSKKLALESDYVMAGLAIFCDLRISEYAKLKVTDFSFRHSNNKRYMECRVSDIRKNMRLGIL